MIKEIQENRLQPIHEGHYSRLMRYDDLDSGAVVLVKLARSASPLSRHAALFANELKITQRFDHPGIRKALEAGSLAGKPALYLDYIDGISLKDYCTAEKPTLTEKVSIGVEIANILTIVHSANIVYKNLNSDHVMMSKTGQPVLIDFSIAVPCTLSFATDRPDRLEGNLAFISPEQTGRINRAVDYRTDLYSLGVVLYEMLCGTLPFAGNSIVERVHDHIARTPPALCERNPDVPEALSDVVMKLLAKSTDDRYQSATGVARDLGRCLAQLRETGRIQPFTPGEDDVSARLLLPHRLYGRDKEQALLEQALDRTAAGGGEVVFVTGPAGSGKTLLINELKQRVLESGGVFVVGNYDQYQRNIPYNAFNQAFFVLNSILSADEPDRLSSVQLRLRQETEPWRDDLKTILPGLQRLMTGSVESEDAPPRKSPRQPFDTIICKVLRLLARECGFLVLVLDNLQWADSASLAVMRLLSDEKDGNHLLTIGACDERLTENDCSLKVLGTGQPAGRTLLRIQLENLDRGALQCLVEDMVKRSDKETAVFAGTIFDKTGGNPMLAVEFIQSLYEAGELWFDYDASQWHWDIAVIHEKTAVDDVIASVALKVQRLPERSQELLMKAACMGNSFSIEALTAILGWAPDDVQLCLKEIQDEHLVISFDDTGAPEDEDARWLPFLWPRRFAFIHARVRQVAYAQLPAPVKRMTHLSLGRLYLSHLSETDLKNHMFTVVDHLNEGFRYIDATEERLHLAELNRIAGERARTTGAYKAAVWYLNMGLGLLPRDRWECCPETSRKLLESAVEAEYLICNFPRVHVLAEELADYAEDAQQRAKARKFQILAYMAQGNRDQAFTAALNALEALGILNREERPEFSPVMTASLGQLDMVTIVKASQMLSREINLDRLLDKFMQIVMENAGAEKGVLIIDQEGRMVIQARRRVGAKSIATLETVPLADSDEVPQSVIESVASRKEAVVLGDAHSDPRFLQDTYILTHRTRSILGLPILHQANLVGVLYLENNLATNIFTPDQLPLLNALLSQAAISLENAKLYASLEEKVRELSTTKDELVDSRNWLDRIINAIGEPIFVKDRRHCWLLLNDALCEFMGRSREELLGKSDHDVFPKEEADVFWTKDELVFTTGEENANEEKISDAQGKTHTIITRKTLYTDEKGNQYLVGLIQDITERVNLEEQLRQAQKMESIGRLAGGVAHDFNNILSVILGYSELSLDRTDPGQPVYAALQEIMKAAQRSTDITRQLLAFARKQVISPKLLDLNKTISGMIKMLQRLMGEDIHLTWVPGEAVGPVMIDPGQIDQILANLCVNARDAIADVGNVTIETGSADLDETDCEGRFDLKPGEYSFLIVRDNGSGMDGETLKNIFEPFFTTKESGKGTGLGLATVYGIVKQNEGFIDVSSELNQGTRFKIYLPRHGTKENFLSKRRETQPIPKGHETVLLVEDEPAMLKITKIMLEELGYVVTAAETPRQAIIQAEREKGGVHLLLTDVIMPEMNGRDLANHLLSFYPGLQCLFMSGYTADVIAHHGVLEEGVNFLQKPFSKEALGKKIREILDKGENGR